MSLKRLILIGLCGALMSAPGCSSDGDDKAKESESDEKKSKKKKKKRKKKKSKKKSKKKKEGEPEAEASAAEPEEGVYPPPKPGEVPIKRIGAWSRVRMNVGTITWSLLEERGTEVLVDAKVVGRINIDVQAWVDVPDFGDASTSMLKSMKYRMNGGAIQTFTGSSLGQQQKVWANLLTGYFPPKVDGLPKEDVTVPAGTFRGCYRWKSKTKFMGKTSGSTVWTHPAVPAPSMVKMLSDDGSVTELIAFGKSGAKPSL